MGKREGERQPPMWSRRRICQELRVIPSTAARISCWMTHGFDDFAEAQCATFYAETMGRPGLPPDVYFRLLLIGYFEGIDSERGIAWRAADSLALRDFLGIGLDEAPPDHSTISRTRRLIDLWMRTLFGIGTPRALQGRLAAVGLCVKTPLVPRTLRGIQASGVRSVHRNTHTANQPSTHFGRCADVRWCPIFTVRWRTT
jgi:hypothetical protein